jgi:hypothetical protein
MALADERAKVSITLALSFSVPLAKGGSGREPQAEPRKINVNPSGHGEMSTDGVRWSMRYWTMMRDCLESRPW